MSSIRGRCVVAWLERWGDCFLRESQPYIYQQLLLHVGATDVLRRYDSAPHYWHHVQVILDCFFTSRQRAMMCAELISDPLFLDDPAFVWFRLEAKSEITCQELISNVEASPGVRAAQRSFI